jgi:hypothetical protein
MGGDDDDDEEEEEEEDLGGWDEYEDPVSGLTYFYRQDDGASRWAKNGEYLDDTTGQLYFHSEETGEARWLKGDGELVL